MTEPSRIRRRRTSQLIIWPCFTIFICIVAYLVQPIHSVEITTDSIIGQTLLQNARKLENNHNNHNNNNYYWMANYSLKFQGCHNVQAWNYDADEGSNVRIKASRLARFRLCPSRFCSQSSNGCSKGYGDYVIGIDTYVSAYVEAQRKQDEYECERYLFRHCNCEDNDDKDMCVYKCYTRGKKWDCIDNNPYYDDDATTHLYRNDLRDFEQYFQGCSAFEGYGGDNDKFRRLEDGAYYYIGSYCSEQGGKIFLGMFTDDTCTTFADNNAGRKTFKEMTGVDLPFSDKSMVRSDCVSCNERDHKEYQQNNKNNNNSNNNQKQVRILDSCEEVYEAAGKCETHMGSNNGYASPQEINEDACYYMEGLKLIRKNGIIDTSLTRPNNQVNLFITIFSVSFTLLGAFIYYLRMSKFHLLFFLIRP